MSGLQRAGDTWAHRELRKRLRRRLGAWILALAIAGLTGAFWVLLLIALAVMLLDDGIRLIRKAIWPIHKEG